MKQALHKIDDYLLSLIISYNFIIKSFLIYSSDSFIQLLYILMYVNNVINHALVNLK